MALLLSCSCPHPTSEVERRVASQWRGTDSQRVEFVKWVNREQPFNGFSKSDIEGIMGRSDTEYGDSVHPYSGLSQAETMESLAEHKKPVAWEYRTLREVSKGGLGRDVEGSYLLDLVVQFDVEGKVYGAGTVQFTTGEEYYDLLEERWGTSDRQ